MAKSARAPEIKLLEAGQLMDTYGGLLTERQRRFMRLHFENDLSFSEIAREFGVSRQAVHDSVKHAVHTLRQIEGTLGLVEKAGAASPEHTTGHIGGRQLIERLEGLRERVRETPEAERLTWLTGELDELIALLRGARS
jgi:predicted DNA-binding protein YlxM (UPF0122 family)